MLEGHKISDRAEGSIKWWATAATVQTEFYRYDGTNIRLREVSLGYSFPQRMLEKTGFIKGVDLRWWHATCSSFTKTPRSIRMQQCQWAMTTKVWTPSACLQRETLDSILNSLSKYLNDMNKIKYTAALLFGGLLSLLILYR